MTKITEEQQQIDNDEISLKELIQKIQEWIAYLKTQWKLIIGIAALGGIIGFVYAYRQTTTYKAVLTFALEEDKGGGGVGGAMGLASSFGFDLGGSAGGAFSGSNLTELMKSRKLIEKTLLSSVIVDGKTISIAEYYIQINNIRKSWNEIPAIKNVQFLPYSDRTKFTLKQDSILFVIYKNLVSPDNLKIQQKDKKIAITSIEVINKNEKFSKIFCESIAKEISSYYTEIKSKKARINLDILQFQTDSIRSELNNAITGVAAASDNVFNLNSAMNIKRTPSSKRQVDVQANTAILNQLVGQLELAKVSLRKETPLLQVIDGPILPLEKNNVNTLNFFLLGSFLAGFLTVLYLVFGRFYRETVA
jgi:uncharacterized protein involved in exopolysaccharide biosynthesis